MKNKKMKNSSVIVDSKKNVNQTNQYSYYSVESKTNSSIIDQIKKMQQEIINRQGYINSIGSINKNSKFKSLQTKYVEKEIKNSNIFKEPESLITKNAEKSSVIYNYPINTSDSSFKKNVIISNEKKESDLFSNRSFFNSENNSFNKLVYYVNDPDFTNTEKADDNKRNTSIIDERLYSSSDSRKTNCIDSPLNENINVDKRQYSSSGSNKTNSIYNSTNDKQSLLNSELEMKYKDIIKQNFEENFTKKSNNGFEMDSIKSNYKDKINLNDEFYKNEVKGPSNKEINLYELPFEYTNYQSIFLDNKNSEKMNKELYRNIQSVPPEIKKEDSFHTEDIVTRINKENYDLMERKSEDIISKINKANFKSNISDLPVYTQQNSKFNTFPLLNKDGIDNKFNISTIKGENNNNLVCMNNSVETIENKAASTIQQWYLFSKYKKISK